jgi:hypothetical protein
MSSTPELARIEHKIDELRSLLSNSNFHSHTSAGEQTALEINSTPNSHGMIPRERYNIPGGVMISLNVRTQTQSALNLRAALEARGIHCWIWWV